MKYSIKLFFLFFFCANVFGLKAQQKHFIYVQSEDKQPFAVVMSGKVYSSSDYGYVIVPKLIDGTYNFTVSFPMNKFPDQAFTCIINKKDAGFILKNNTDGWALENLQTKKVIPNNSNEVAQKNAFGDMLSEVVRDSDLTKKNIATEKPADTSANIAVNEPVNKTIDSEKEKSTAFVTDSIVQLEKISEYKADTGTNMMFVDKSQTGVDTINVFVPADTENINPTTEQKTTSDSTITELQKEDSSMVTAAPSENYNTQAFDSSTAFTHKISEQTKDISTHTISNPFYKSEQKSAVENSNSNLLNPAPTIHTSNAVKQDCANVISDEDLNKVKRKMFVQSNNNDMIQYAVRSLGKKCITTEQVKALGNLFSSDDGRYTLYDALYMYVYDYGNYPILANQILDPYYKKRFSALLR